MSKVKMQSKPTRPAADLTLTITRVFDAPRSLVFQAWTEPERVKRWWGPESFTTPVCEIDLRPGGVFRTCMRSPEGRDFWSQMAEHYKSRSTYLYYEILNEPHGMADARWAQIPQKVISAIRAVDRVHTIVVTGAGWGSYNNLNLLPTYRDDNLIYTFHFYDPFLFTHQGAGWTDPSMVPLAGVPFWFDDIRVTKPPGAAAR